MSVAKIPVFFDPASDTLVAHFINSVPYWGATAGWSGKAYRKTPRNAGLAS